MHHLLYAHWCDPVKPRHQVSNVSFTFLILSLSWACSFFFKQMLQKVIVFVIFFTWNSAVRIIKSQLGCQDIDLVHLSDVHKLININQNWGITCTQGMERVQLMKALTWLQLARIQNTQASEHPLFCQVHYSTPQRTKCVVCWQKAGSQLSKEWALLKHAAIFWTF